MSKGVNLSDIGKAGGCAVAMAIPTNPLPARVRKVGILPRHVQDIISAPLEENLGERVRDIPDLHVNMKFS